MGKWQEGAHGNRVNSVRISVWCNGHSEQTATGASIRDGANKSTWQIAKSGKYQQDRMMKGDRWQQYLMTEGNELQS